MIFHYIPKDQLRTHWEFIKEGLEIVRTKGHMEWIVEDVYCDCYENRSMIFMGIVNDKPEGFIVLQPIGNTLHIWATWSRIFDYDIFTKGLEEVKAIARQGGKTRVTFSSQRKGWERRARLMGFKPQTWEFIL
jgi:hypothetical protein